VEGKNKVLDKLDAYIDKKFAPKPEKSGIFSSIADKKEAALQAIVNQLKGCDEGEYLDGVDCVKCRTCAEGETVLKECDGTTTKDVVKCEAPGPGPLGCSITTDCDLNEVCIANGNDLTDGECTLCADLPLSSTPPYICVFSENPKSTGLCIGGPGDVCGQT